jgi:hypothetical protein
MNRRGLVLLAVGSLLAVSAGAGEPLPAESGEPDWGTSSIDYYSLHAFEFAPIDSSTTYSFNSWMTFITGGYAAIVAGVHLPTGAKVLNMFAAVCDESAGDDIIVRLWRCPSSLFTDPCVAPVVMFSTAVDGCAWMGNSAPFPLTIDNDQFTYFVEFNGYTGDSTHRLDSVRFAYQLQVSPPPATATFGDVPTGHMFFQYVEALAASGITAGCGGGDYCPDQPVTRGQMAVFLSKALGLHWTS